MSKKQFFKVPVTADSYLVCRDNQLELVYQGKETEDPQYFDFDTTPLQQEEFLYTPVLCGGWYYFIMNKRLYVLNNGIIELLDVPDLSEDFQRLLVFKIEDKERLFVHNGKSLLLLDDSDIESPILIPIRDDKSDAKFFVFNSSFILKENLLKELPNDFCSPQLKESQADSHFSFQFASKFSFSWQCFNFLLFEAEDEFILVDLLQKSIFQLDFQVAKQFSRKNAKFLSFLPPEDFFVFTKCLQQSPQPSVSPQPEDNKQQFQNPFHASLKYLLERKTANEEAITAYELGEHWPEYQKLVEERTFQHLITFNPLVKEHWEQKVGELQREVEMNSQLKKRIEEMARMTTDQVIDTNE